MGDDKLAIMEPEGRFVILSLTDGRIRADQALLAEPRGGNGKSLLQSIHLFEDAKRLILVTNRSATTDRGSDGKFGWAGTAAPLVTGRVYALNPRRPGRNG